MWVLGPVSFRVSLGTLHHKLWRIITVYWFGDDTSSIQSNCNITKKPWWSLFVLFNDKWQVITHIFVRLQLLAFYEKKDYWPFISPRMYIICDKPLFIKSRVIFWRNRTREFNQWGWQNLHIYQKRRDPLDQIEERSNQV